MSWTLVGNLVFAGSQMLLLVVLAKVLPPVMLGRYGLGVAIAAPILMLTNLQLRPLQATNALGHVPFAHYLLTRLATTAIAAVGIAIFALAPSYSTSTTLVVLFVGVAKCAEAIADVVYGHLQRFELMNVIARSTCIRAVLTLIAAGTTAVTTQEMVWVAVAIASASVVSLIAVDLPAAHRTRAVSLTGVGAVPEARRNAVTPEFVRQIFRRGVPLGVTSVLLALAVNIPRYALQHEHGEALLGYFVAIAYPTAAFSLLLSAFGQAASPRMAEAYLLDPRQFQRLVLLLSLVPLITLLALATPVLLLGPGLLQFVYRPDYSAHFPAFVVLLVSGALWGLGSVLGYAATCSHRLDGQAPAAGIVCVVSLTAAALLIPRYGVMGAAIASAIGGVACTITYALLLRITDSDSRSISQDHGGVVTDADEIAQ